MRHFSETEQADKNNSMSLENSDLILFHLFSGYASLSKHALQAVF